MYRNQGFVKNRIFMLILEKILHFYARNLKLKYQINY